jgi:hypothetical protein
VRAAIQNAPEEDEPLSPEEEKALAEAVEDHRLGRLRSWPTVRRELPSEESGASGRLLDLNKVYLSFVRLRLASPHVGEVLSPGGARAPDPVGR